MQRHQFDEAEFESNRDRYVDALIVVCDDHAELLAKIEEYRGIFSNEQLGELLADAVANGVDADVICKGIADLHDKGIYLQLIDASYGKMLASIPHADLTYGMCLHAVSNNGMLLQYVPDQFRDDNLYKTAVSVSPLACEFVPPKDRNAEICMLAASDWQALIYVPQAMQTEELLMRAVRNSHKALHLINPAKRTKNIYLEAIQQSSEILSDVPNSLYCYELCHAAISRNADMLNTIKRRYLTDQEFLDLAAFALQKKPDTIKYLTKNLISDEEKEQLLTPKICLSVAEIDGTLIAHIPISKRTKEICIAAMKQNPLAAEYVDWNLFSDEEAKQIIMVALPHEPAMLEYIPERFKKECIDRLSVDYLLTRNFKAYKFLPTEYSEQTTEFFKKIKNVVVSFISDHEIKDLALVYANTGSRTGATTCCWPDDKEECLGILVKLGINDINLVLIGHAMENYEELTTLTIPDIVKLIKDFSLIQRVTLIGCDTAKALELDEEIKIADQFKREFTEHSDCAFGLMTNPPDHFTDVIKGIKQSSLYLLVKDSKSGKDDCYKLYFLSWPHDKHEQYTMKHFNLNQDGFAIIKRLISPHGKGFKFPKDQAMNLLRGSKGRTVFPNMTHHELMTLDDARHNKERSDKTSHGYKEYKKVTAYLRSVTIESDEIFKLKNSLLKKLVNAIAESDITRTVAVKGYTQPLYVDTAHRRLHTSKTKLYKKSYTSSFFEASEDNIDRDKLRAERASFTSKAQRTATKNDKQQDNYEPKTTKVKAIIVNVKKRSGGK